jgi:hypothetical protein
MIAAGGLGAYISFSHCEVTFRFGQKPVSVTALAGFVFM